MNRAELYSLCCLLMCSDPWPTTDPLDQKILESLADRHSEFFGFSGWIEAYHDLSIEYA